MYSYEYIETLQQWGDARGEEKEGEVGLRDPNYQVKSKIQGCDVQDRVYNLTFNDNFKRIYKL